jgi:hypothetical protein
VGSSSVGGTDWTSDSSIIVRPSAGVGSGLDVRVSVDGQGSVLSGVYSYSDPPVVSRLSRFGSPMSGGVFVTILGRGFASVGSSISVGGTFCVSSVWTSDSSMRCLVGEGVGGRHTVSVFARGGSGDLTKVFSYGAGAILGAFPLNAPPADGGFVSITGVGFGKSRTGIDNFVGSSGCLSTEWVSDSSVVCRVGPGVGGNLRITSTIGGVGLSELAPLYSFDVAIIEGSLGKAGTFGGPFTIRGRNFGNFDSSPVITAKGVNRLTQWTSDSSARAHVGAGIGSADVFVAVGGQRSATTDVLIYSGPVVSGLSATFGAASGSLFTIFGAGFGLSNSVIQGYVGESRCDSTAWVSDSSVVCRASGTGAARVVRVTVAAQGSQFIGYTFVSSGCEPGSSGRTLISPGGVTPFEVECVVDNSTLDGRLGTTGATE